MSILMIPKKFSAILWMLFFLSVNISSGASLDPLNNYNRLHETQNAYREAVLHGDTAQIAETCYLLGKRHINIGQFSKAQQWLLKSLNIRKSLGLPADIGKIYLRLSEIQIILENSKAAENYTRLAIANFTKANSAKGLTGAYRILGDLHQLAYERNNVHDWSLDSAEHYYMISKEMAELSKDSADMAITYQSLARTFELKSEAEKSLSFNLKAMNIYEQKKMMLNIVDLSAKICFNLLIHGRTAEAKKWLDKAMSANQQGAAPPGIHAYLLRAVALYYEQMKDWQKALFYQKQILEINRGHSEQSRLEATANINLAYENELRTVQLVAQKKESELQKKNMTVQKTLANTLFLLFVVSGIACALFYLLYVKYRKISRENAILVKEQNHRTKNNLQSVSDLLSLQLYRLSDPGAVAAMEESLLRVQTMTLIHRSLYQGEELVYINLQKYLPDLINMVIRSYRNDAVGINYNIDDVLLHTDEAISLGLIINELTTNACKYAFTNHSSPNLHISCFFLNGKILFNFSDNGPGLSQGLQKKGFGMDLIKILTERLKGVAEFSEQNGCAFSLSFQAETKSAAYKSYEKLKI